MRNRSNSRSLSRNTRNRSNGRSLNHNMRNRSPKLRARRRPPRIRRRRTTMASAKVIAKTVRPDTIAVLTE